MLSGYMLSVHNLLPHLLAMPWFPLVIMSFLKYFDTTRTKYLVYTSVFLSMEFFAGAPEIAMMIVLILFVLLFFLDSFSDSVIVKDTNSETTLGDGDKKLRMSLIARHFTSLSRRAKATLCSVIARSISDVAIYCMRLLLPLKRDRNDKTLRSAHNENKRENTDDQDNTGHSETNPICEPATRITLRQIIYRFRVLLIVIILFLLITSVQFLPFLELKSQSIRSGGLNYFEATLWSFAWKDFIQFYLPDAFGYFKTTEKYWSNQSWLKTVYLGVIPFILSVFFFASKDRKKWIFLLLMLISFLFALGGNTPIYHLLHKIPPFNSIRYPVKFLFLFFFVISITSGKGLDRLIEGVKNKNVLTKKIIQIVFYSGFCFAAFWGYLYLFDADVYVFLDKNGFKPSAYNDIWFNLHNAKRFLLFAFLFCVVLLVYLRIKNKKIALYALVLLIIFDLFLANYGFYRSARWDQYIAKIGFADILSNNFETERYFITEKTGQEFELFPLDRAVMSPAYASLFRLYTIKGSEVMRVNNHENFLSVMNSAPSISDAKRFFDMSGVRHIITSYKVDDDDLKLVKSMDVADKTAYLYEYTKYPGRFLLFSKVSFAKDDREVIEKLQSNAFDSRSELILLQPPGVNSSSPSPRPSPARGEGELLPSVSPARGEGKLSRPHGVNSTNVNCLSPSYPLTPALSRQGRGRIVTKCLSRQGRGDKVAVPPGDMVAGGRRYGECPIDVAKNKDVQGRVKLLSYKANRFSLEYEADSDAFLYVSDTYYPGWRAYVDGKETKIYRANLAFRAIEAPKGKHTVVFKYVPMSFYFGLVLTIIGILLCIWLWRRDKPAGSKELRAQDKS